MAKGDATRWPPCYGKELFQRNRAFAGLLAILGKRIDNMWMKKMEIAIIVISNIVLIDCLVMVEVEYILWNFLNIYLV